MPKNKEKLDGKDRGVLSALATTMSHDVRVFGERIRQEIGRLTRNGVNEQSIAGVLSQDFKSYGRIFGEFRNSIKRGIVGGINQAFSRAGNMGEKLKWVAISKNLCDDCATRAGEVDTWEGWQARGMPASGWSVCKEYCYCQLVPADMDVDDRLQL